MIDQANMDIDFVGSFLDLLSAIGEGKQLEFIRNHSIVCMCSESKIKLDGIKTFVKSIAKSIEVSP